MRGDSSVRGGGARGQEEPKEICIGVNEGREEGWRRGGALVRFLLSSEMSFEGGAVLMFGLQFGFELFDEELEAADLIAQFLNFRRGDSRGTRRLDGGGCGNNAG